MEFRLRPDNRYLQQASWDELYVLTEHWQSDMEFYRDELRFLRDLVDKYFIWLIKDENIAIVQNIAGKLLNAEVQQKELGRKIAKHLIHITELIENAFSHDQQQFRDEHAAWKMTLLIL